MSSSAPNSIAAIPAPFPARMFDPLEANGLTGSSCPARQKVSSFAHALRGGNCTHRCPDTQQILSSVPLDQTIHLCLQGPSNRTILWNDVASIAIQPQALFSFVAHMRSTRQYLPHVSVSTCDRSVHIKLTIQSRSSEVGNTVMQPSP